MVQSVNRNYTEVYDIPSVILEIPSGMGGGGTIIVREKGVYTGGGHRIDCALSYISYILFRASVIYMV